MAGAETYKELSTVLLESGNRAYAESCADGLEPVSRCDLLLKASKLYSQALVTSKDDTERAKCNKNLGEIHWKHAELYLEMFPEGKEAPPSEASPSSDILLSIKYYLSALGYGRASNERRKWSETINEAMENISQHVVDHGQWLLSEADFLTSLTRTFCENVAPARKSQPWAIFSLGFAQSNFGRASKELGLRDEKGSRNYRACQDLLQSCGYRIKEAERHAKAELLPKIEALKKSVASRQLICRSIRASVKGHQLLEESKTTSDSTMRHDLKIAALEKFKEAVALAKDVDVETEAEANVEVGDVCTLLNKDQQAQNYYTTAVSLAQHSDGMHTAEWYQRAKVALTEAADKMKRESDELETVFRKLTTGKFLEFVYRKYPPRGEQNSDYCLGELKNDAATKAALKKALLHYHPDHNAAEDDAKWKTICGEITKLLVRKKKVYSNS